MLLSFLKRWFSSSNKSVSGFTSEQIRQLKAILGFNPGDQSLYELAFKHRSAPENLDVNNERLEYLGDSVLSTIISDLLFERFPKGNEGFLSELRSKIVNRTQLNDIAFRLGCKDLMSAEPALLNNADSSHSILGNALEALIGAIYIDKRYAVTKKWVTVLLDRYIDITELSRTELNFKSRLLEWAQKSKRKLKIHFAGERIEEDNKLFLMQVILDDEVIAEASDVNKKEAEQKVSEIACGKFGII